jgi:hypothetical protein
MSIVSPVLMKNSMTHYPLRFKPAVLGSKAIATLPLLLALASTSMAALIVTPGGYETREGNYADGVPFGTGNRRLQQVISAQEFSRLSAPISITSMALREHTNGFGFAHFITNQINLSTTTKAPDALSPVFAENVGLDETVVVPGNQRNGIVGGYLPGDATQPFATIFTFAQPFVYDPQAGNLLIEIRNYGGIYTPPGAIAGFDAVLQQGDGVSWVLGDLPDSPMGRTITPGYVIQFEYTIVPEPSSLALFGLGALGLAWFYRKRRCWHKG